MNTNPLISVIVPAYNVEKYVGKCIDSIIAQSYENWELILIDDGSSDNSASVCEEYANKDKRIDFLKNEKNCGVSATRNRGIECCTGEYVLFLDSDDWFDPEMFKDMLAAIIDNDADMSVCGVIDVRIDENGNHSNTIRSFTQRNRLVEVHPLKKAMYLIRNCLPVHNKLLKRSLIGNARFDTSVTFQEDVIFLLEIMKNADRIAILHKAYYYYYINRSGNVVSEALNKRHLELINNTIRVESLLSDIDCKSIGVHRKLIVLFRVLSMIPRVSRNKPPYKEYYDSCYIAIKCIPSEDLVEYVKDRRFPRYKKRSILLARFGFKYALTRFMKKT